MISPPPPPPHAVDRPALRARLDDALGSPLTLLVAPAGAGKTVLLSQWALSRPDLRFLWLEAGRADDDPARFLRRLLRGLGTIDPAAAELAPLLTIGGGGLGAPLLAALVELLAERPGNVLIFDDLQLLTNRALLADLWWLADHVPTGTHLVFSSRVDLRLAWSRHRLRYALLELRQAELAFDADVAAEVLRRITGDAVSAATVESIMERTEGWPAGVQLSAIGLRDHVDGEQFAQRLAGTDRLIAEYLSEEVLEAQSDERRMTLLRMSALETISAPLVESALGVTGAAELFAELQDDSMFLVPLDDDDDLFRFHHLFRDLLRYRLRAALPGEEQRILASAAEWYVANGDIPNAIETYLRAHSWDAALDLLLKTGREAYERVRTAPVARWLAAIPESVRHRRAEAEVLYGIVLGMSGDSAHAEDVLRTLSIAPDLDPGLAVIVHAYLAARVQFRPQVSVSLEDARVALRLLDEHRDTTIPDLLGLTSRGLLHTMVLVARGRAHLLAGQWPDSRNWLTRGLESPGGQYSVYRVHTLGSLALLEALSGRLDRAKELADEALELARDRELLVHPAPADAYLALALIAVLRGTPDRGSLALHEGAMRAASNQRTQLMWVAHLGAVLIGAADLQESVPPPAVAAPPIVRAGLEAAALRDKRLSEGVADATPRATPDLPLPGPLLFEVIACALSKKDAPAARALLTADSFAQDEPIDRIQRDVLAAWLAHVEGRGAESRQRIARALERAAEQRIVSVFVWAGPEVMRLVESLPGTPTPFRTEVIRAMRAKLRSSTAQELPEPLTDRERELLTYLPTRLTNAELAAHFFVSVNTIKTHMAHIYRKLDAPNRSAAVTRATDLGLL